MAALRVLYLSIVIASISPCTSLVPLSEPAWLGCQELSHRLVVATDKMLGSGANKFVYEGVLDGRRRVAVSRQTTVRGENTLLDEDFDHGLMMLKSESLTPSPYIVNLIGSCQDAAAVFGGPIIVTELHSHNTLFNFVVYQINKLNLPPSQDWQLRCSIVTQYLEILSYLHESPTGTLVFCDSNSPEKALSQFMVSYNPPTRQVLVKMHDVDALPVVGKNGVLCGHQPLHGEGVAPEQRWNFADDDYADEKMVPYSEKTDVWKVPRIVELIYKLGFLKLSHNRSLKVFAALQQLRAMCRDPAEPNDRPTMRMIAAWHRELFPCVDEDATNFVGPDGVDDEHELEHEEL